MKRSEMIKIIERYIGVNFPEYINESEMYSESLLDIIEDEGMSPPEYLPEPEYTEKGKQLQVKPVRKWEKE